MLRSSNQLAAWQRATVHATGAALLITGGIWLAVHYAIGAGAGELPHPLEAWTIRLHALAAWVGVFTLGMLSSSHVAHGWRHTARRRLDRQRHLGVALCTIGAALILSGYALMYLAAESMRPALGWAHALAGAAMAVLLVIHSRFHIRRRR